MRAWMSRQYSLAALIAHAAAPERQILGRWLTQSKDGLVQIYLAATGQFEGRISGGGGTERLDDMNPDSALRTQVLRGRVILQGFRYAGARKWTEGTLYDPNNGKTYKCNIELTNADTLTIRGYTGMSLFGRTIVWRRKRE